MPDFPKIQNPFEDETDSIDTVSPQDVAKQAVHGAAKQVNQQVVKPTTGQLTPDQAIVDFLYGASSSAPQESGDSGIEQLAQQGGQQQAAKMQQIMDPDKQMSSEEKRQYTEEQKQQREKERLHQRNYYTVGNKLDDIGTLEEQVAKMRQLREQEEQQRKQEEEEEEQRKKQEEEEQKQQLAQPTGKKTGVPDAVLKREQNKAENKTGFSG